ncbi:hypothetical protein [Nonomuraea guangzhouensis]|uniref:Secreted protein n=1 Tax=Nonomuraea guangzhouensis TaxID=1291555 RepID=A0ABW4G2W6_9ACTN|nr:hypothetical protein [Nonomuraea guangzhouensis]
MATTRSSAVLVSGTANTAKLFVAALAFTGAYVGFSAYDTASSAPRPTQTVTLSARELPITSSLSPRTSQPAKAGKVSVSALPGSDTGCVKTFVARSVVVNPDPDRTVMYDWRLARWSADTHTWRTYFVDYDGFAGDERTVDWRPRISANPGWYRIELNVEGTRTVKSDRFQVSC